ncbi:MAG: amidohydrolase family protein [Bryobacteraceae bacterium]|nr:amidohydrolase family protein [Bryobacteraceae bacterium]
MKKRLLLASSACLIGCAGLWLSPVFSQDKPPEKKPGLPLKTERKLDFSTSEGTWMSLTVSPDGGTILFDLLGDLYTLPVAGGEAKLLMGGLAFEGQPAYSPDGKRIAFLSDREGSENLWVAGADGSNPKQLSKEEQANFLSPAWSRDGQYVLVSKSTPASGAQEIWMYHVDGGAGIQYTKSKERPDTPRDQMRNHMGPVMSPDGKHVYFAERRNNFTYNATFPLWQVVRKNVLTGEQDTVTNAAGSGMKPLLSPDGKTLVFATRLDNETGLRIRDLTTGEESWLKYPVQRDEQESVASRDTMPAFCFLPDGKSLITNYAGKLWRIGVPGGQTTEIPFTANVSLDLGPQLKFPMRLEEGPVRARLIQGAIPSPDGTKVAFSALTKLYRMDLPSGRPARVTTSTAREYQPAWSPDGQWLAYATWDGNGGNLWKVRADGSGAPQQLSRLSAYYRDPVWSPDGSKIVVLKGYNRTRITAAGDLGGLIGMDLVSLPAAGGDPTVIMAARGAGRPHFRTAEPDRVYVYAVSGGGPMGPAGELVSVRFDGTDRRRHLKVSGPGRTPDQPAGAEDIRVSPDGRFALAKLTRQLYLVSMPPTGGAEPIEVKVQSPAIPARKLTDLGADDFAWAEGGNLITWSLGASLFRLPVSGVNFDPKAKPAPSELEVAVEAPRAKPSGSVVLRGAKIITMKGDETIPDGDVLVTDNRIAAVGRRGAVTVPAGARIVDVKGMTIMPGVVDTHAHYFEIKRGQLEMDSYAYLANLAYGITTGRDPQTMTNDAFAYQDLIESGEMLGPRAFSTGPGIFSDTNFKSYEEARDTIARYKKYYRTNTVKSYMVGNRQQRQWVVQACKENGIMPTTEGGLDLKLNLTHAIDGMAGNEHSFPVVPLMKDTVELFAKSGIFYTPTLLVAYGGPWAENYFYTTTEVYNDPKLRRFFPTDVLNLKAKRRPWFSKDEHVFPKLAASAAKIVRAGGRVCIGGHGQIQGIQCHWEMWALAEGGLSNHEVLRAATLHGAEAIGMDQDLGSIEGGKLADLIVLKKDPLADIRNTNTIQYVMKNGELFEGDTLNQVWPAEKPLKQQWWWKDNPAKPAPTGGGQQ